MPEIRKNIATNEWVVIATERAKRPDEMAEPPRTEAPLPEFKEGCPFCPGNEDAVPDEILRSGTKENWQIRVVPNKYPALAGNYEPSYINDGVIQKVDGIGSHEVIIETPRHNEFLSDRGVDQIENLLNIFHARYSELEKNPNLKNIIIFKNHGQKAGTSLEHPHSQIIATPIVPPHVRYPLERAR